MSAVKNDAKSPAIELHESMAATAYAKRFANRGRKTKLKVRVCGCENLRKVGLLRTYPDPKVTVEVGEAGEAEAAFRGETEVAVDEQDPTWNQARSCCPTCACRECCIHTHTRTAHRPGFRHTGI